MGNVDIYIYIFRADWRLVRRCRNVCLPRWVANTLPADVMRAGSERSKNTRHKNFSKTVRGTAYLRQRRFDPIYTVCASDVAADPCNVPLSRGKQTGQVSPERDQCNYWAMQFGRIDCNRSVRRRRRRRRVYEARRRLNRTATESAGPRRTRTPVRTTVRASRLRYGGRRWIFVIRLLTTQPEFGERMCHLVVQLVGDHALVHALVVFLYGIHVQRVRGRRRRARLSGHSVFQPSHDLLWRKKTVRLI